MFYPIKHSTSKNLARQHILFFIPTVFFVLLDHTKYNPFLLRHEHIGKYTLASAGRNIHRNRILCLEPSDDDYNYRNTFRASDTEARAARALALRPQSHRHRQFVRMSMPGHEYSLDHTWRIYNLPDSSCLRVIAVHHHHRNTVWPTTLQARSSGTDPIRQNHYLTT